MEKSNVYFTDMRVRADESLLSKLKRLIKKAGIDKIDFNNKYVAIKVHFGEPGNLAFLRANFSKVVADMVKELGGKPFLTDCNTLYVGRRKNAIDHIEAAYENGYTPFSTGCQVIIGDGLKGTDEAIVPIKNGEVLKEAKIGQAVMDADIIISLNHFKGHESTGFGGALKNLGMGCGSRAGKMEMHNSGKPEINKSACKACRICIKSCAHDAISYDENGIASIDNEKCVGCGRCLGSCNFDAIRNISTSANDELNKKMAEYTQAVVQDRANFHINIINNVSPFCDCHGSNDMAIIPDVGMMASFDPVAIDVASADKCNEMPIMPNSRLTDIKKHDEGCDVFSHSHPDTDWKVCTSHAAKIGVGSEEYTLIEMK